MPARWLPGPPTRQACGSPDFSELLRSSNQIRITLRTAVVQESPTLLGFAYLFEIDARNEELFFGVRGASHDFAKRVRDERTTPESKIVFAANPVYCSHEDSVQ